jgi:Spy/CpxP family protein refolding chaperone
MRRLMSFMLAALLVTTSVSWAQRSPHGGGQCDRPGWHHPERPRLGQGMGMRDGMPGVRMILAAAEDIKLTDNQKAKLEKMKVEFKLAEVDQRAKVEKAEIKLRALKLDKSAIESEVLAAIDEATLMKADLHKMRYRHQREVRNLLTDEQLDKLKELRKERVKKFQKPHQGMGRGEGRMGFGPAPYSDN